MHLYFLSSDNNLINHNMRDKYIFIHWSELKVYAFLNSVLTLVKLQRMASASMDHVAKWLKEID